MRRKPSKTSRKSTRKPASLVGHEGPAEGVAVVREGPVGHEVRVHVDASVLVERLQARDVRHAGALVLVHRVATYIF